MPAPMTRSIKLILCTVLPSLLKFAERSGSTLPGSTAWNVSLQMLATMRAQGSTLGKSIVVLGLNFNLWRHGPKQWAPLWRSLPSLLVNIVFTANIDDSEHPKLANYCPWIEAIVESRLIYAAAVDPDLPTQYLCKRIPIMRNGAWMRSAQCLALVIRMIYRVFRLVSAKNDISTHEHNQDPEVKTNVGG